MTIRLLIADDHSVVRQGLRLFMELDDEIEVLREEAADGVEAVALARRTRPDVVLMDLLMPDMDGITATEILKAELPDTKVLALTSMLDDSQGSSVTRAVRAGAVGYLLKSSDPEELRCAVRTAASGHVPLSERAAERLVREVSAPATEIVLTPREEQVLELLGNGLANKEIARRLGIGQQTVKTYVSSLLGKLGVRSRTEAALRASRTGLAAPQ